MEKFLIICLTENSGITPFVINSQNKAEFFNRLDIIVRGILPRGSVVYAEVYRINDNGPLEFKNTYSYNGDSLTNCHYFLPSQDSLKNFIEKHSYPYLKL